MHILKGDSNPWQCWRFATLLPFAAAPAARAQPSVQLAIQTYAGLTVTGRIGTVYSVPAAGIYSFPDNAPDKLRAFYRAVWVL